MKLIYVLLSMTLFQVGQKEAKKPYELRLPPQANLPANALGVSTPQAHANGVLDCNGEPCVTSGITIASFNEVAANWRDWTEKGAYHAEFVAPLGDWHCDVVGALQGPSIYGGPGEVQSFTVACAKNRLAKKREKE